MTTQVEAGYVYAGDDDDVAMVGFADDQYDTKAYVLLQRDRNPSEEDRKAGEHKVHITVDDQARAAYGAIISATLHRNWLTLMLDKRQTTKLGTAEEIIIRFPAGVLEQGELVARLRDLFAEEPDVLKIAEDQ
jgi:Immunity protein 10